MFNSIKYSNKLIKEDVAIEMKNKIVCTHTMTVSIKEPNSPTIAYQKSGID